VVDLPLTSFLNHLSSLHAFLLVDVYAVAMCCIFHPPFSSNAIHLLFFLSSQFQCDDRISLADVLNHGI
jgi:hypothetical protein